MRTIIIAGTGAHGPLGRALYQPMARALGGAEVVTLPFAGLGHTEEATTKLARRLLWNQWDDEPVRLVGHSQGGLVAAGLALMSDLVKCTVTLGAPFRGTPWANSRLPFTSGRCMAAESRYLERLLEDWDPYGPVFTVHGRRDRLVPGQCAHVRVIPEWSVDTGHLGLVTDPRAISLTAALLDL